VRRENRGIFLLVKLPQYRARPLHYLASIGQEFARSPGNVVPDIFFQWDAFVSEFERANLVYKRVGGERESKFEE
jgi:hypothetical protein